MKFLKSCNLRQKNWRLNYVRCIASANVCLCIRLPSSDYLENLHGWHFCQNCFRWSPTNCQYDGYESKQHPKYLGYENRASFRICETLERWETIKIKNVIFRKFNKLFPKIQQNSQFFTKFYIRSEYSLITPIDSW